MWRVLPRLGLGQFTLTFGLGNRKVVSWKRRLLSPPCAARLSDAPEGPAELPAALGRTAPRSFPPQERDRRRRGSTAWAVICCFPTRRRGSLQLGENPSPFLILGKAPTWVEEPGGWCSTASCSTPHLHQLLLRSADLCALAQFPPSSSRQERCFERGTRGTQLDVRAPCPGERGQPSGAGGLLRGDSPCRGLFGGESLKIRKS